MIHRVKEAQLHNRLQVTPHSFMWQFEITRDDGRPHFLSFKEVEDPCTVDEEQRQVGAKTTVSELDAMRKDDCVGASMIREWKEYCV